MARNFFFAVLLLIVGSHGANAHEYYLMPESFTPKVNEKFGVRHRLGKKFKGSEIPYIGQWKIRSEIWKDGDAWDLEGLDGDLPALRTAEPSPGLVRVIFQRKVDFVNHETWEEFEEFVIENGLENALAPSASGEKPKVGLKEAYSRFAKTLISVDAQPTGMDAPTALWIELIAKTHPLSLKADEPMPVQLLFEGQPLENALVRVFVGEGNEASHRIRTDKNGEAMIPADGPGPYMLGAVTMTDPKTDDAIEAGAHWESFWASLTYQRAE